MDVATKMMADWEKMQADARALADKIANERAVKEEQDRRVVASNNEVVKVLAKRLQELISRGEFNGKYAEELLSRSTDTAEEYRLGYLNLLFGVVAEDFAGVRASGYGSYIFNAVEYKTIDELEEVVKLHMNVTLPDNLDSRFFRYMVQGVVSGDLGEKRGLTKRLLIEKIVKMSDESTGFDFDLDLIYGDDVAYVISLQGLPELPVEGGFRSPDDTPDGWTAGHPKRITI